MYVLRIIKKFKERVGIKSSDVQYNYIIYRDNRYNLLYCDYDMSISYIDISPHS